MKFLHLTFPDGKALALNPEQVESVQPKALIPANEHFIVGESKVTEGSTVHTIGGSNYTVQEPVDLVVQLTIRAMEDVQIALRNMVGDEI